MVHGLCLLQPQELRLDALDRLADIGAQADLAAEKLLAGHEVLADDTDNGRVNSLDYHVHIVRV
jgi:hypothetical protein